MVCSSNFLLLIHSINDNTATLSVKPVLSFLQLQQEFRDAARQHSLGEGDRDLVADDRILQCAMHAQQQQQQQARGNAAAGLVLLTNDLVLQLKVSSAAARCTTASEVIAQGASTSFCCCCGCCLLLRLLPKSILPEPRGTALLSH